MVFILAGGRKAREMGINRIERLGEVVAVAGHAIFVLTGGYQWLDAYRGIYIARKGKGK
jgi:hypothetical protein